MNEKYQFEKGSSNKSLGGATQFLVLKFDG